MKHIAEMRVDLSAIASNIHEIRQMVGSRVTVMAMVKGDAYGHGGGAVARSLEDMGVTDFGVAHTFEARQLRRAGVDRRILVFQPDFWSDLEAYRELDLGFVINSPVDLEVLQGGFEKTCHVMVDTGMGREGMVPEEVVAFMQEAQRTKSVTLVGIGTHFACADEADPANTRQQLQVFDDVLQSLPPETRQSLIVHAANSGGIINYPDSHFDMVRPGIFLYGLYQGAGTFRQKTAMSVFARLVLKKKVPKGWNIGYGATYTTPRKTLLGVLGLGYADGLLRASSNLGDVWYEGRPYKIRGRVSMDQIVIDLDDQSHIPLGAEFMVFGGNADNPASVFNDAGRHGTITYERATQLGVRLPKVYI